MLIFCMPGKTLIQSGFSVGAAIELARVLEQLPPILIVYAIEGENFSTGIGVTSKVERAAQVVVERVCDEVQNALK